LAAQGQNGSQDEKARRTERPRRIGDGGTELELDKLEKLEMAGLGGLGEFIEVTEIYSAPGGSAMARPGGRRVGRGGRKRPRLA